jgi:hypothetical protein
MSLLGNVFYWNHDALETACRSCEVEDIPLIGGVYALGSAAFGLSSVNISRRNMPLASAPHTRHGRPVFSSQALRFAIHWRAGPIFRAATLQIHTKLSLRWQSGRGGPCVSQSRA